MSVFQDTSALYALLVRTEEEHEVVALDRDFEERGFEILPGPLGDR